MTYLNKAQLQLIGILLVLICFLTTGCSASKTSSPLNFSTETSDKWTNSRSGKESDHVVELKSRDSSSKLRGFATAFKTCGYTEATSLRGASRQFFVGLEKIQINSQGPIEISPYQLWKVEADALNEGFPISLATYTLKKDRCFFDFALWIPKPSEHLDLPEINKEIDELRGLFCTLVSNMIPHI